jgi:hypothetical protein
LERARAKAEDSTATPALRLDFDELQGGLDPNKISGVVPTLGYEFMFFRDRISNAKRNQAFF